MRSTFRLTLLASLLSTPLLDAVAATLPPTELPGLRHDEPFFPNAEYRASVPAPATILGFPLAERAATPEQVDACVRAWTEAAPDRSHRVEYARSHEGRPLQYVIVTSPANLARLEAIQNGLTRLGDPRQTSNEEADRLIANLPAVAWLAYTIHGDETEGSDAALAMLHYLIASDDPAAASLRERLVIIIDPLMNPDGRGRFLKMVAEHRGTTPNVDDQSLLHSGYWPRGRGNHYLFDLNRDSILGVHPETRGRVREVARWSPVLFVDAHGMGAQETHLFSPPREPVNPNLPAAREHWAPRFAQDQARAFDRHGLVYYTGEWNEEWYPGYADAYAAYRGAVGILYEQARIAEDGVRRPGGRILSYRESVQHHVIGSLANLTTAAENREALLRDFWRTRQTAVAADGLYAQRTFAVLPTANHSRLAGFLDLMRLHGFEMFELTEETSMTNAMDQLGRQHEQWTLPPGTILLPNRQPLAHLLAAVLEFDPRFSPKVLEDERRELLLKGESKIYDTTTWSLTMFHGLTAFELAGELPEPTRPLRSLETAPASLAGETDNPVAYVFPGEDDQSVVAAARLMERGVEVRLARKPSTLAGVSFSQGAVVVTRLDNRSFAGDLRQTVSLVAAETGLPARGIGTGLGDGDLPDLGGDYFVRLEPPRLALLGREESSAQDFGATWHLIDHTLAIRHSHLARLSGQDLARYNVLVLPGGRPDLSDEVKAWVRAGGTLVALGGATAALTGEKAGWSRVRQLPDVLGRLDGYELAVFREWMGQQGCLPETASIWSHPAPAKIDYPWESLGGKRPDEKELKRRDDWQSLFMPQGAFVATRADTNHWLTAGCGPWLPVMVGQEPVLMAETGVEAPTRYGFLEVSPDKPAATANVDPATGSTETTDTAQGDDEDDEPKAKEVARIGWAALPPNTTLHLRMSGLLWPEAAHRLAHAAWCTREAYGRGQIILFATPPAFRGTAKATSRALLNALVYGPGLGAAPTVRP